MRRTYWQKGYKMYEQGKGLLDLYCNEGVQYKSLAYYELLSGFKAAARDDKL